MKARAFALTITAILLCALAAGSADDIDNCCFVDRQCGSEQDWIDGWQAWQNNQCQAPAQSRTTGGAPAQVDNCCYVDRQCGSEQDWINGWQAWQNNQCGAPAPSQPAGGSLAQIDNCCYVDRQCGSEQDWIDGWQAWQNNQCGAPGLAPAGSRAPTISRRVLSRAPAGPVFYGKPDVDMVIEGSTEFIAGINTSLDLLKLRAPQWYDYTVGAYDYLVEFPLIIRYSTPDLSVTVYSFTLDGFSDTVWFTGVLVHYACHMYQHQRNLKSGLGLGSTSNLKDERECTIAMVEAMELFSPGHSHLSYLQNILANIDKPEYQWWLSAH
ncbi:MAG: hypothetical protein OXG85_10290 [Chloroflexi bacterium]|nr:hypothetical protein [Chloroflexota bacterium]